MNWLDKLKVYAIIILGTFIVSQIVSHTIIYFWS